MKKPKKILIVRTDRLGDVILSTPVIKNLRSAYPKAHIVFMCRPYTVQALEGNPYLDELIVYDKYGKHKSLWASIKFSLFLRSKKFDWAIILHPTNRVNLVTFLAGIPFRAGWDRKLGFLLSRRIAHHKQEGKKHEVEYTLDILRKIGVPVLEKEVYFPINKDSEAKIEQVLKSRGLNKEDKLIVIHPCASCPSKRWPQDYFLELIKLLKAYKGVRIAVISSQAEKEFGEKIAGDKDIIDLRAKLDISQTASLLKRAVLFISNDSGPVHIAAGLKTPVISIFGRKNPGLSPKRWRPLGENSYYIHKDPGCPECLAHNCQKGFICLKNIKPQEVYLLAKKMIKG